MALNSRKWKRLQRFVSILSKHGFQELVHNFATDKNIPTSPTEATNNSEVSLYTRIRLVLEELGPTFIKLGQAFSNREDILPKELTIELQKLQDNVPVADIDILKHINESLNLDYKEHFLTIQETPIAAASIAQVYRAILLSGAEVVLKVKRPNIQPVIEEDLMLIKMFGKFLKQHFEFARKMHLYEGILSFETALLQELSFDQELNTIQHFQTWANQFKGVHIPITYPEYSNNEIVCMEYIKGAKITDVNFMQKHQLVPSEVALKGLHAYLDQILNFGSFHADPHAGNVLVTEDGTITFIDFGTVGQISNKDRALLEDFILYLLTKNIGMLTATLKKIAIEVHIENERQFEQEIAEILAMIQDNSLDLVDPKMMLEKFKNLVHENDILLPSYIYLLVRGVMLIESIGRSIYPEINLVSALQPYIFKIIKKRMHWKSWGPQALSLVHDVTGLLQTLPKQLQQTLLNLEYGALKIKISESEQQEKHTKRRHQKYLWLGVLGLTSLCGTLLFKDKIINSFFGWEILPYIMATILVLSIWKVFFSKS